MIRAGFELIILKFQLFIQNWNKTFSEFKTLSVIIFFKLEKNLVAWIHIYFSLTFK